MFGLRIFLQTNLSSIFGLPDSLKTNVLSECDCMSCIVSLIATRDAQSQVACYRVRGFNVLTRYGNPLIKVSITTNSLLFRLLLQSDQQAN